MPRRVISEVDLRSRAIQAARRMIARGERPGYRLVARADRTWGVDGLPGIAVVAADRRDATIALRVAIAAVLEVDAATFDIET